MSRLVEQGAGGGEKSCTVQQISQDANTLRALPHASLRNVPPKVGRGSGLAAEKPSPGAVSDEEERAAEGSTTHSTLSSFV